MVLFVHCWLLYEIVYIASLLGWYLSIASIYQDTGKDLVCAQLNSWHIHMPEKDKNTLWLNEQLSDYITMLMNILLFTLHYFLLFLLGGKGWISLKLLCWYLSLPRWVYFCCVWFLKIYFWPFSFQIQFSHKI